MALQLSEVFVLKKDFRNVVAFTEQCIFVIQFKSMKLRFFYDKINCSLIETSL